jgi:hypothetical protein
MNHSADYVETRDAEAVTTPVSVAHLVHTLRAYSAVILVSLASIAIGYTVVAILLYILSPAQRTTEQAFRLDFRGAAEGTLPNGVRFSPTEIVSTPILLKIYQNDQLSRFISFGDFSRSVFVLESNREYEKLVADYQSRLSDPRLSPLDRDRLQKEFDLKSQSISKSDFAVAYGRKSVDGALPETLVRKVLVDILNTWADFATNEQHGLDYRVAVLTPAILDQSELQSGDPIVSIQVLRSKIYRVIENIEEISELPAAELMRTSDHMSLIEIRMRLEDIVRFRLEPLVGVARASGLSPNPPLTIHFLENQLAYDERRLQAAQTTADGARDALALYNSQQVANAMPTASAASSTVPAGQQNAARPRTGGDAETVMPQLSDTFLERLVSLTRQASDAQYRQKLVDDYRKAVNSIIPIAQAVSYQKQVLDQMKSGAVGGPRSDAQTVRAEIDVSTAEVRRLIVKMNEVYQLLSRNLNASTQLFTLAGPPTTRIERARTFTRLALYGLVLLLVALPVIVILCLLHNRVREEEAAAARAVSQPIEEPA